MKSDLLPTLLFVWLALALPADAQEITVNPGNWQYSANGVMGPIVVSESGTECVAPEEAMVDLRQIVEDLDAECVLSDIEQSGEKLTATLTCQGALPLTAELDVAVTDSGARANIRGQMSAGEGLDFPVDLSATAIRTGAC